MAGGLREIKNRIKSTKNTKQVTKAMEAVSASKMRKAVNAALTSRNYSNSGWQLISNLSQHTDENMNALLKKKQKVDNILLIFITSDRGLCGGFNSQIIRQMMNFFADHQNKNIDVISVGKKGQHVLKKINKNIIGAYEDLTTAPTILKIRPIAESALKGFVENKYDQVNIVFTDYKSALAQKPMVRQLLPLQKDIAELAGPENSEAKIKLDTTEYIFEPDPKRLLDFLLPRLLEVQIYQTILESAASEHSARMLAMRNATDAATDMISELTLTFNQARQASITREIAEIAAGGAALEK